MTDKLFDSFVKQKLKNFESEVPEGLWDKIMPEDEKKPVAIWWWNKTAIIIAIAITAGLGTTYFVTKNKSNKTLIEKDFVLKGKTIQDNSEKTYNSTTNNNLSESLNKNNTSANDVKNQNVQPGKSVEQDNNSFESNLSSEFNDKVNKTKSEKANKVTLYNKQSNSESTKNNYSLNKNELKNTRTKVASENILSEGFVIIKKKKTKSQSNFTDTKNNLLGVQNSSKANNQVIPIPHSNSELVFGQSPFFNLAKTTNKSLNINLGNLFGKTEDCPTAKGSSRNDFYIELYASPDYTFKKVVNSSSGLEQYLVRKDSVEVLRGGFTIGGRISKSITNNLLLKVGLQYSQVNEEFRLKTENERRQTIIINSHTINRPGMSDTTISDTTYYLQIGYRVQKNMNYYRNLELPILLSYELGNPQDKWKFAINGGAIINLTSWYEGRTLDANYNMVSISTKSNNTFYKQEVGCSLYGGLSIMRRVSDNVDVFAEPYFRLSLNKMESVEGFSQKFNAVGLQFGARINLTKNKHY